MEWRPCPQFAEYVVSESGQVKRDGADRALTAQRTNSGYVLVNIAPSRARKAARLVHRLVCEAFHGPPPADKPFVDHIDRDRLNNHYSNLRWVNWSENNENRRPRQRRTA